MSYRILTKNAVENTNIDGARDHNFNAGRRSGIVKGALNSGNLFLSANNTIALDTCELRLCGHRVVIDNAEYKTFYNQPSVPIRYSLVAQIIVSNNGESVSFDLKTQLSTISLVQNDLDKNINGTYELEIGRFTQLTDGTLTDVVRTADLITGGGNNDSEYIRIGTVTTNKISPELDADVDIENTINPDDNKPQTNFTFNLPTSVGTVVSVNGEEKTSINTDITPIASSENLITSGGVHDYPAVTFAESERQKSKNLLNITNASSYTTNGVTLTIEDNIITLNGTTTGFTTFIRPHQLISTNVGKYAFSFKHISGTISGNSGYQSLYNQVGKNEIYYPKTSVINDITSPTDYNQLRIAISANITFDNFKYSLQYEQGDVATDYQPYNGAIVHEKEIADVEHIETIYDYSDTNKQTIDGVAYTNGILFNSSATYTFENLRNKYKGVYVDIKLYTPSNTVTIYIPFTALSIARSSFVGVNSNVQNNEIAYGVLYFENNILHPANCASHNFTNTAGSVSDLNNNDRYSIIRIKGVLL